MEKIYEYKVVHASGMLSLVEQVQLSIREGWQPFEQLVVLYSPANSSMEYSTAYFQSMVMYV